MSSALTLPSPPAASQTDPDQMHNLADKLDTADPKSHVSRLHARLNALLLVLKTCVGDSCRQPWSALFTNGSVRNLQEAMHSKYDEYFRSLPSVKYSVSFRPRRGNGPDRAPKADPTLRLTPPAEMRARLPPRARGPFLVARSRLLTGEVVRLVLSMRNPLPLGFPLSHPLK